MSRGKGELKIAVKIFFLFLFVENQIISIFATRKAKWWM